MVESSSYQQFCWSWSSVSAWTFDEADRTDVARLAIAVGEGPGELRHGAAAGEGSRQVRTLTEGSFVDRRENLLLFGKTGTGKTHLLSAIAKNWFVLGARGVVAVCVVGSRTAEG